MFADDTLTGGSGWAGAGLLGLMLAWLLTRHIPAIMLELKEARVDFKAALQQVVDHCEKEMSTLTKRLDRLTIRRDNTEEDDNPK